MKLWIIIRAKSLENIPVTFMQRLVDVVDPQNRKLRVPMSDVEPTRALLRDDIPSLCLLHLSSRCRQGAHCHQLHANPDTIAQLRQEASLRRGCCQRHGDDSDGKMKPHWRQVQLIIGGFTIEFDHLAYTVGLETLLDNAHLDEGPVVVHPTSLCRLHAEGTGCRYCDDCRFVHVCRGFVNGSLARLVPTAKKAQPRAKPPRSRPLKVPLPQRPSTNLLPLTPFFSAPSLGPITHIMQQPLIVLMGVPDQGFTPPAACQDTAQCAPGMFFYRTQGNDTPCNVDPLRAPLAPLTTWMPVDVSVKYTSDADQSTHSKSGGMSMSRTSVPDRVC